MKRLFLVLCFLLFILPCAFSAKPLDSLYGKSLEFVANLGQWEGDFRYRAALRTGAFFAEDNGYSVALISPVQLIDFYESKHNGLPFPNDFMDAAAYHVSFIGSNQGIIPVDQHPFSHHYNFFYSKNHNRWVSNVFPSSQILYSNLYNGIDLLFYESFDHLKYTFIIHPYSNPVLPRLRYQGVSSIRLNHHDLVVTTAVDKIIEHKPFAFQIDDVGDTVVIPCEFEVDGFDVSFKTANYDHSRTLYIDPVLVFSSFSGSTVDNWGYTATYDSQGNLYGGGIAFGVGYPVTYGAYQIGFCNGVGNMLTDVSLSKFNSDGDSLIYSTYLGGSLTDIPHSLFVNDNDELYVFGSTGSCDFPVTPSAFDTSFNGGSYISLSTALKFPNGSDIFVSKFSADGSTLLASTFMGGTMNDGINTASTLRKNYADENRGEVVVDDYSNVYVVSSTYSPDFPVTQSSLDTSYNGGQDVCAFKLSQDLSHLVWSSFLGGSGDDAGYSMYLASDKSSFFCGGTKSLDFPASSFSLLDSLSGVCDGFVAHLSSNGDALLGSTFLGRSGYDQAYLIKGDRQDFPYIIGQTDASSTEWISNAQYAVPNGGQFLTKLSPDLDSIIWSTAFGTGNGGPDISPTALLVDYCNNIYISGWGSAQLNGFGGTNGLPVTSDAFQLQTDGSDYYFMSVSDDASQLIYATYFGGSANGAREHVDGGTSRFDRKGRIYQAVCAGCGGQSSFPTTPGAWSETNGSSNCNLGVIKMDFSLPVVVADFAMPSSICAPQMVHFVNHSQVIGGNTSYHWDFGDGTTSTQFSPTHHYVHSGIYSVRLIVQDYSSCNMADTLTKSLLVLANSIDTLSSLSVCYGDFVQLGLPPSLNVSYQWEPSQLVSNSTISNPTTFPQQSMCYTVYVESDACADTLLQWVTVDTLSLLFSPDTTVCVGDVVSLSVTALSPSNVQRIEWSLSPDFTNVFSIDQAHVDIAAYESSVVYVRVLSRFCTQIHSFSITVLPIDIYALSDVLICFEEGTSLQVGHTGGSDCTYHWRLSDGSEFFAESPFVSPLHSTHYFVTVTNSIGCTAEADADIIKREGTFPTDFDAWCERCTTVMNEGSTVFSTDYGEGYIYHWSPEASVVHPDSAVADVRPQHTTTYTVQVTDTFGCVKTDTVTIEVAPLTCDTPFIFIPNVFTPNGDGHNDVVFVRSSILQQFHFMIYSRWGEKVFESTSQDTGWDGSFKGGPCQNGVYDYYFNGVCIDGQESEIKGNIMLVR